MLSESDLDPGQRKAVDWMKYRTEALIALPVGYGKTIISLTALKEILDVHPDWEVLLISTLNIVRHTWHVELGKWGHLPAWEYVDASSRNEDAARLGGRILGINFESLEWYLDLVDSGAVAQRQILIIDESTKMKASNAKRVQRMAGLRRRSKENGVTRYRNYPGYVDKFERRFLLSGTPMPESHADLWAQEALLGPRRRLGEHITDFRKEYCQRSHNGFGYEVTKWAIPAIEEKLQYVFYQPDEDRDEALGLEPCVHREIDVPWSDGCWDQYREMEDETVLTIENTIDEVGDVDLEDIEVEAPNAGVMISKLRQLCSGFVYDHDHNTHWIGDWEAKPEAIQTIMDGLADTPLLIFTQFKAEWEILRDYWPEFQYGMPTSLDAWNAGDLPGMAIHPASAGHGLNMQAGSHVCVFMSMPYSNEQWSQAWGRLHRRGQQKQVSALRLQRPNSVELDVWNNVQGKSSKLSDFLRNMRQRRRQLQAA